MLRSAPNAKALFRAPAFNARLHPTGSLYGRPPHAGAQPPPGVFDRRSSIGSLSKGNLPVSRFWKWTLGIFAGLLLAAFIGLSILAGSPKDAYGMVSYALPHMRRGTLKLGDDAPDATIVALDGVTRFHLRERTAGRPLVLVFGSFT